jgi:Pyruvate/2-oxoacid:ferredoxin oxidoreductase delta subunit
MKKDLNKIAAIEKAIKQKYGDETIQNPKANWDEAKEKEYLEQLKKQYKKDIKKKDQTQKVETNGFLVSKQLLNKDSSRNCPVCRVYSFELKDDLYMDKYECCHSCYVEWVEGREERWLKEGWRPDINGLQKK